LHEHGACILGNILIGGGIGFVIDVMTKSGSTCRNTAHLKLHPSIYGTHSEIDAYYDPLILAAQTNWAKLKPALRLSCDEPNCDAALKSRVTPNRMRSGPRKALHQARLLHDDHHAAANCRARSTGEI
jgi:hypothetical protein